MTEGMAEVMSEVVTVTFNGDDPRVRHAGEALARLLGAGYRSVQVAAQDAEGRVPAAVTAFAGADAGVLAARPDQPWWWEVVTRAPSPVLVVPEAVVDGPRDFVRVLLPLDGTPTTAAGVARIVRRVVGGGGRVVAAHVFDVDEPGSVPAFWDQPAHSQAAWSEEFLHRYLPEAVDLDLRRGRTAEEVLAGAQEAGADLLVLAWRQHVGDGHAATVRQAVTRGTVPVLLVPVLTRSGTLSL